MLQNAKYLYFSKSIDLSREEERFFSLAMVNSGHLFSCLHADRSSRDYATACVRERVIEERLPQFGKGK